jgi:peroxiredoxin
VGGDSNPADGNTTLRTDCYRLFYSVSIVKIIMKHFITILILCFCAFLINCSQPKSDKKEIQAPAVPQNELPQMTVTTSDQSSVNLRNVKGKTMLILFQPDCDHCQREAEEIRKHLTEFREYELYFISADEMAAIEEFGKTYDLLGHSNVKFAATTVESVLGNFGPISAPSVYIYRDQTLVKKFNGEVGIDSILQAL